MAEEKPASEDWRSFSPALISMEKADEHQIRSVCSANLGPNGDRSAIVDAFRRRIDRIGFMGTTAPTDVEHAERIAGALDRSRDLIFHSHARALELLERYLPGLKRDVQLCLISRVEHWKAEAFQRVLTAQLNHPPGVEKVEGQPEDTGNKEAQAAGAGVPAAQRAAVTPDGAPTPTAVPSETARRRGRKPRIPVNKERLRGYRDKLKMTQEHFARECDVDPNTIQRGEAGEGWESDTYDVVASGITRMLKDADFGENVTPEDLQQPQNPKIPQ